MDETSKSPTPDQSKPSKSGVKRNVVSTEGKEIILRMLEVFEFERNKESLVKPLSEVVTRAAIYAGVSEETVLNADNDDYWDKIEKTTAPPAKKTSKKRKLARHRIALSDEDALKLRSVISSFYIRYSKSPSFKELLAVVTDEMPLVFDDVHCLKRALYNIGYVKKKVNSKRILLVENPELTAARDEYLKERQQQSNNKIFYVYECLIDKSFKLHKICKSGVPSLKRQEDFLLFCVASSSGFLNKATVIGAPDDWSEQNLSKSFVSWQKSHLIPHLPIFSVVVFNTTPCTHSAANKLTFYTPKSEMVSYLHEQGIECNEKMRRIELFQLIEANAPDSKSYAVGELLQQFGHTTLHIPRFMSVLNPIYHAMQQIQGNLHVARSKGPFTLKNVTKVVTKLMAKVSDVAWKNYFTTISSLEDEFWKNDSEFEVAFDNLIQTFTDSDKTDSDESDESLEEYSDDELDSFS